MNLTSKIYIGIKAFHQLGPKQMGLFGLYQLGLRSGHYKRHLSKALAGLNTLDCANLKLHPCLPGLPNTEPMLKVLGEQVEKLYEQADEIVDGKFQMFGGPPVALVLNPPDPLEDWSKYEFMDGRVHGRDIKFIWEPGRLGWACTLAMAYHLSKREIYLETFWKYTGQFLTSNPPYQGPHWCSAQEVAIRLVALAFALQVFAQPGLASEDQLERMVRSIAIHAERIPPTMVYARAQNNNHLISEALGLYTASVLLPDHPCAARWHDLGWHWLRYAFHTQIDPDGTYVQHSTNYHRLMLQAALWAFALDSQSGRPEQDALTAELPIKQAVTWLSMIIDPKTGHAPNYGHNDGSYILPLTVCDYQDYRPVLDAASQVFLHFNRQPDGPWKDMSLWLGVSNQPARLERKVDTTQNSPTSQAIVVQPPFVLANQANASWAMMNATEYHSRPAHADQLHVDLWWHGLNLALDPGTYLYNASSPWENSLVSAFVHNTVTVDGQEFMNRAGRFLYLDWAQAKVLAPHLDVESKSRSLTATHDGYRKLGITHTRTVATFDDGHWEIEDDLDGSPDQTHAIRLQWLLPDWQYEIYDDSHNENYAEYGITVHPPQGKVTLLARVIRLHASSKVDAIHFRLARAGELLQGTGPITPVSGWYSPTYGEKIPALACILEATSTLPLKLVSTWILPDEA